MSQLARVLLVDDSISIRNILKVYLMALKVEFIEAESGERALQLARLMSPNLIIADVNMPGMDGITLLQMLRMESSALGKVPVLLLTGERDADLESRGLEAGANAFIRKPVAPEKLLAVVKQHLGVS